MSTAAYTESTYSTSGASGPSAASSAVGSPYSQPSHNVSTSQQEQWIDLGLGIAGGLPSVDMFSSAGPYSISSGNSGNQGLSAYDESNSSTFVDPALVSYDTNTSLTSMIDSPYTAFLPPPPPPPPSFPAHQILPPSPSPSDLSSHESSHRSVLRGSRHASPLVYHPYPTQGRRRNSFTRQSQYSHDSPRSVSLPFEDEGKDRGRCPNPDCGRTVKDLKAHMLTHQAERPEKCPIVDCEYHIKGFARKYDRCRHTLTHFKGTMVCDFCPNSGSSQEKSFNRADVFKRHLTSVHGVEQSPPNSRKKSSTSAATRKTSGSDDKVAKCSTCSSTFRNAQEFYDHLDDCVLKYLDKGEASEGINAANLNTINNDKAVKETMERNSLPTDITSTQTYQDFDEDDDEGNWSGTSSNARSGKGSIKSSSS